MKLNELKTYSDWDKQYIMDSLLRDAIILKRHKELQSLIELGANVNCAAFSQVCSSKLSFQSKFNFKVCLGSMR